MALEREFAKSKRLQELSERLVAERKALSIAQTAFITRLEQDIKANRVFLAKIEEFSVEYKKVTEQFMKKLSSLKSLHELIDMNRKMLEVLES